MPNAAPLPFTRLVTGTTIGVWAAVVPLSISGTPFFARIAEVSPRETDPGLVDVAIRYGNQRFDTTVTLAVIAILIALVCLVRGIGDLAVRPLKARQERP